MNFEDQSPGYIMSVSVSVCVNEIGRMNILIRRNNS